MSYIYIDGIGFCLKLELCAFQAQIFILALYSCQRSRPFPTENFQIICGTLTDSAARDTIYGPCVPSGWTFLLVTSSVTQYS